MTKSLYTDNTKSSYYGFWNAYNINKKYFDQNKKSKEYTFAEDNNEVKNKSIIVKTTLKPIITQGTNQLVYLSRNIRNNLATEETYKSRLERKYRTLLVQVLENRDSIEKRKKEYIKKDLRVEDGFTELGHIPIFPFEHPLHTNSRKMKIITSEWEKTSTSSDFPF